VTLRNYLAVIGAAVVIAMVVLVWFFPYNDDFGVENPLWNGIEELNSVSPVIPLESLSELPSSPEGEVLLLVPYVRFTASELDEVSRFVNNGGTLVLADDYGYGNQVLKYLEIEERFSGYALLDPLFNHRNERLPRIYHFNSGTITNDVRDIVLNHATCLINVSENNVLAYSSAFAYIDINGNEEWDEDEATRVSSSMVCRILVTTIRLSGTLPV